MADTNSMPTNDKLTVLQMKREGERERKREQKKDRRLVELNKTQKEDTLKHHKQQTIVTISKRKKKLALTKKEKHS